MWQNLGINEAGWFIARSMRLLQIVQMARAEKKEGQKMKLIGAILWVIGIVMAGAETTLPEHIEFTVNIAGLLAFITGNLIIYKGFKNANSN